MKVVLSVLFTLLLACFATAASQVCTPTSNSCDFYLGCLEKVKPCGSKGYAVGYGDKYCNKFSQKTFHSDSARRWLSSAKKCLQEKLVDVVNRPNSYTCERIVDHAFDSHPTCYTLPGTSICDIRDPRDLTSILFTVEGKDLFSLRSGKQIKDVIAICARQILTFSDEEEQLEEILQEGEAPIQYIRNFWLEAAKIAKVPLH